jgi:hypothetical protein
MTLARGLCALMRIELRNFQHGPLMHRDVVGFVALDLVLRLIFAGMVHIAFVFGIARVDLDYSAGYIASFGVPANMIADFEVFSHLTRISLEAALRSYSRGFLESR